MPSGQQEQQIGEGCPAFGQPRQPNRQCMRLKVIDSDKRQAVGDGDALAELASDKQPPNQPWAGRCGDTAKVGKPETSFLQYSDNLLREVSQMRACSDFWHDASERRVFSKLAQHGRSKNSSSTVNHC